MCVDPHVGFHLSAIPGRPLERVDTTGRNVRECGIQAYQRVRLPRAFLSVARRLEYRFNEIRRLYCIKIGSQTRPNNPFHIWNLNRTTQEH